MFGAMVEGRKDQSRYGSARKRKDKAKRVSANMDEASGPDLEELLDS